MVNLRRSSNAEQAEVTETFPRRERGAAEVRGDRPPLRRRWAPAAVRPAHRSSGTTDTQAASAQFADCVSVSAYTSQGSVLISPLLPGSTEHGSKSAAP